MHSAQAPFVGTTIGSTVWFNAFMGPNIPDKSPGSQRDEVVALKYLLCTVHKQLSLAQHSVAQRYGSTLSLFNVYLKAVEAISRHLQT